MMTVLLLTISNIFMTFAWYGHLKYKSSPLWIAILASWGIAFLEYCFQVPANRIGHRHFTATQLKVMQEVITLIVFCGFAVLWLGEELRWNYFAGFACILAAVVFVFGFEPEKKPVPQSSSPVTAQFQVGSEPANASKRGAVILSPTAPQVETGEQGAGTNLSGDPL